MSCPGRPLVSNQRTSPKANQQYYSKDQKLTSTKTCRQRFLQTKRHTTHYFLFCDINVSPFVFSARFRYYDSSRRVHTRKKKKLIVSSVRYAFGIWDLRRNPKLVRLQILLPLINLHAHRTREKRIFSDDADSH